MLGAAVILRLATIFPSQQRTAMGAAILDDVDFAPGVPGDDDGTLADPGSLETVRLGNLAIETDEIPRLSVMKDLEFLGVNLRVGIDPRGHARHAFVGPGQIGRASCRERVCPEV